MEGLNQKKSSTEVFGTTQDSIVNKILERVIKDFPKEKMYHLYNEGNEQNDEAKLKQAREMFANALGKFLGEASYIFNGSDAERIKPLLKEYKIEGLDPQEILNVLCSSQIGIMKSLRSIILNERCPLPKYTIARLIQSFDPDFIMPQMSLPSGYQYEHQQISAISNDAAKENEIVEEQTSETNKRHSFDKLKSFFQNRKNKKTISATSVAIGICMVCGGIVYAFNSEDKNKKAVSISFGAVGAFFIGAGIYIGEFFKTRPPSLVYVGRKFTLDEDYLAVQVNRIGDGSVREDNKTHDYKELYNIFHSGLKPILNGTDSTLYEKFPKKEDRELYIEVARSYVKTWYNITEEFPDVIESIMEKKKERDKKLYFLRIFIPDRPSAPYDWNKVFLDTDPQPWGPGRKPEDWREGDGIVEEEKNMPFTSLDLTGFPTCECSEPKISM